MVEARLRNQPGILKNKKKSKNERKNPMGSKGNKPWHFSEEKEA